MVFMNGKPLARQETPIQRLPAWSSETKDRATYLCIEKTAAESVLEVLF
jgi:hypothetical protein